MAPAVFYSGYGPIVAAPFLLGYVPGALALLGAHWAGQWSWVTFVAGYILLPILDLIVVSLNIGELLLSMLRLS